MAKDGTDTPFIDVGQLATGRDWKRENSPSNLGLAAERLKSPITIISDVGYNSVRVSMVRINAFLRCHSGSVLGDGGCAVIKVIGLSTCHVARITS